MITSNQLNAVENQNICPKQGALPSALESTGSLQLRDSNHQMGGANFLK